MSNDDRKRVLIVDTGPSARSLHAAVLLAGLGAAMEHPVAFPRIAEPKDKDWPIDTAESIARREAAQAKRDLKNARRAREAARSPK